ncbi:MAG TPA: chalcone isomerase family protein [Gammaproteobacteria bacterium]|nr:chalcone isomerase family protein [Gammaproteobacteria bacterium]
MIRRWLAAAVLTLAATSSVAAQRVTVNGAGFPASERVGDHTLALAGTGTATYRIFITVYAAAFYAPSGTPRSAVLDADVPRRLVIQYFHDIRADQIVEASMKILRRQLSDQQLQAIADRLQRFMGWLTDVTDGDRYAISYEPGTGTTLYFNGRRVGTIEGADFARAYFGIWLDDKPVSDDLRSDLLADLTRH